MISMKQNDTGIGIEATLSNENGPVNLTGANVLFLFGENEIQCGVNDAPNGVVLVIFEKSHTEKTGIFNCEFEVSFNDGRVETFPNNGYEKLEIVKDLGGK